MLARQTLAEFLENLAAKKPTPGGGSASALSGALAAALVEMVANLTVGRKNYKNVEAEMRNILAKAHKLRLELLELVDKDARAYENAVKAKFSQESMIKAAEIPLETARKSLEVLQLAKLAAGKGNQNTRSDAFCALGLATAGIYGALENVKINLPGIEGKKNDELRHRMEEVIKENKTLIPYVP